MNRRTFASTVLIVDDDRQTIAVLRSLLGSQRYHVRAVTSGAEALALLEHTPVDLVLLDLMMPGIDGIEVCRALRAREDLGWVPVVFMTLLSDRESRVRAKEAGADDFLLKPIDSFELLVRIENLLRLRDAQDRLAQERDRAEAELAQAMACMAHMERLSGVGLSALEVSTELVSACQLQSRLLRALCADVRSAASEEELCTLERVASRVDAQARRLLALAESVEVGSESLVPTTGVMPACEGGGRR